MGERGLSGTATVVFTDLVGSTELMARLGDVAFDALRGEHFTRLREAIAAHRGQEVKNTGDGLMATFSSTVDAVACAVALQQATDRQSRVGIGPVAIRVGVSLGDVFGTAVVEAARLVAAARPGQILATAVVRMVAGSRAPAVFSEAGTIELRRRGARCGPESRWPAAWPPRWRRRRRRHRTRRESRRPAS